MVQSLCMSGKPTGRRDRLFLRLAKKKQTVAISEFFANMMN
jgi:hypothetical protein